MARHLAVAGGRLPVAARSKPPDPRLMTTGRRTAATSGWGLVARPRPCLDRWSPTSRGQVS
jgi:hypothetical protein